MVVVSYSVPIADEPAQINIGSTVYVGVILTTTDPELKVVVNECFTTASADRESTPRYDLIVDK